MAAINICVLSGMICWVIFTGSQVPTLCCIENDLPPVDAVAGLKWRILQICRDLYNLSNHGTLNQGKTLHLFFIRTLNISNWEEDSTT